jgi:SAM-dependent methyltransferase
MSVLLDMHHRLVRLPRTERVARPLAELAGEAATILDVGAGDGRVGAAVAAYIGARAAGVDVKPNAESLVATTPFDGVNLPFDTRAFDVVLLSDVLHHSADPLALLRESLRVASSCVTVKDHFAFGALSAKWLELLDRVGNAQQGVEVTARYFTPASWLELVRAAGGEVTRQLWPLEVHAAPIAAITRSALQFAARVQRKRERA